MVGARSSGAAAGHQQASCGSQPPCIWVVSAANDAMIASAVDTAVELLLLVHGMCIPSCHSQMMNTTCETAVGYDVWHGWGCSGVASSFAGQRKQV